MSATLGDVEYAFAVRCGFTGTREEWDADSRARLRRLNELERRERAQRRAAAMKQRRTSARSADPSIGRTRPAWQRYAGHRGIETIGDRAARTRRGSLLPQRMRPARVEREQQHRSFI